ncbi:MAG: conjugal transfer protein TraG [Alphaproteobacteria bacterium]|nr:MAG: conjugal transfer protein TraG [Alphaproteobacteria bacterium]
MLMIIVSIVALPIVGVIAWLWWFVEHGFYSVDMLFVVAGLYLAGAGFMFCAARLWKWVQDMRTSILGTARFAGLREAKEFGLLSRRGVLLGKQGGQYLRFNGAGHLMTISRTRGGKGVSAVIPNLLDHKGSVFCIDIKGENYALTFNERKKYGNVYAIAPFEKFSAHINPLDFIRLGHNELDDVALIAELIVTPSGGDNGFWEREAKSLLVGLICYVVRHGERKNKNLAEVRRLLTLSPDKLDELLEEMAVAKEWWIRRTANTFMQKADKERSGVISTAQGHTRFLDSERVQEVTATSDFSFTALKHEITSVYLIIPPHQMAVYKPFMRLMVGLAQACMTQVKLKTQHEVLFLLDEFPSLGKMPVGGFAYLAGYGVKLWAFTQSIAQLEAVYGKMAQGILSNCAVTQMWSVAPADVDTAERISRTLGEKTVRTFSRSRSSNLPIAALHKNYSESETRATRRLLTADEILCLPKHTMLLMIADSRPYLAKRIVYYQDRRFAGRYGDWQG